MTVLVRGSRSLVTKLGRERAEGSFRTTVRLATRSVDTATYCGHHPFVHSRLGDHHGEMRYPSRKRVRQFSEQK